MTSLVPLTLRHKCRQCVQVSLCLMLITIAFTSWSDINLPTVTSLPCPNGRSNTQLPAIYRKLTSRVRSWTPNGLMSSLFNTVTKPCVYCETTPTPLSVGSNLKGHFIPSMCTGKNLHRRWLEVMILRILQNWPLLCTISHKTWM